LAPKAPAEKESFSFDSKPSRPQMPGVDKRKLAPLLKALGGSIPIAPVFVAAEQVKKLLSHREEATRPRQISQIEGFSVTGRW
jgi:hypothetical protein